VFDLGCSLDLLNIYSQPLLSDILAIIQSGQFDEFDKRLVMEMVSVQQSTLKRALQNCEQPLIQFAAKLKVLLEESLLGSDLSLTTFVFQASNQNAPLLAKLEAELAVLFGNVRRTVV